jgi:hypothetical protein
LVTPPSAMPESARQRLATLLARFDA